MQGNNASPKVTAAPLHAPGTACPTGCTPHPSHALFLGQLVPAKLGAQRGDIRFGQADARRVHLGGGEGGLGGFGACTPTRDTRGQARLNASRQGKRRADGGLHAKPRVWGKHTHTTHVPAERGVRVRTKTVCAPRTAIGESFQGANLKPLCNAPNEQSGGPHRTCCPLLLRRARRPRRAWAHRLWARCRAPWHVRGLKKLLKFTQHTRGGLQTARTPTH